MEHEERRKTLDRNLEINKESAKYNDGLERKRYEDHMKIQEEMHEKNLIK